MEVGHCHLTVSRASGVYLSLYIYVCVCAIQWLGRSQGGRGIHIGIHIWYPHIIFLIFHGEPVGASKSSQPNHMIGLSDVKWHVRLSGSDAKAEQLAGS